MWYVVLFSLVAYLILARWPKPSTPSSPPRDSDLGPAQSRERSAYSLFSRKRYFFTKSEAAFFHSVRQVVPSDHHVFPKVRLSDLVTVEADGRTYYSAYGRIAQKHLDFVLCDASFRPYLVVEIDGRSHRNYRQQYSDRTKDRVLAETGLPLVRLEVGSQWDLSVIARYIPGEVDSG